MDTMKFRRPGNTWVFYLLCGVSFLLVLCALVGKARADRIFGADVLVSEEPPGAGIHRCSPAVCTYSPFLYDEFPPPLFFQGFPGDEAFCCIADFFEPG